METSSEQIVLPDYVIKAVFGRYVTTISLSLSRNGLILYAFMLYSFYKCTGKQTKAGPNEVPVYGSKLELYGKFPH